jgi:hypothetical protein
MPACLLALPCPLLLQLLGPCFLPSLSCTSPHQPSAFTDGPTPLHLSSTSSTPCISKHAHHPHMASAVRPWPSSLVSHPRRRRYYSPRTSPSLALPTLPAPRLANPAPSHAVIDSPSTTVSHDKSAPMLSTSTRHPTTLTPSCYIGPRP